MAKEMNTSSGMSGGLIKLGGNLESPRDSKPSDYPAIGPSGAAGEASGQDQLVKLTVNQEGPCHTEDDGDNTPSVWGKLEGISVTKSKAEAGTSVKWDCSVDFNSGMISPSPESYR
jgi:hypothetical protein